MLAMTSDGLRTISREVEEILVKYPEARSSDEILYGIYLCGKEVDFTNVIIFFREFARISEKKNIASFGTVSRARRKVQEQHPELHASQEVEEGRDDLQGTFFDFARGL